MNSTSAHPEVSWAPAAAAIALSVAMVVAVAGLSVFAPSGPGTAVLFADADGALAAIAAAGGRVIDSRLAGHLMLVVADTPSFRHDVVRMGAVAALPFAPPVGCVGRL